MGATGYTSDPAAVDSVNGLTGAVDLDAADVGADPAGTAAALAATLLARAATVDGTDTVTVNRPATGTEGEDIWQARYAGQRGLYVNGYGCARARVPNHADAAEQYAFRAACHSSKNGSAQAIGSFADSNNVDKLVTRANGDTEIARDLTVGRSLAVATALTVAGRSVSATGAGLTAAALNNFTNPTATPARYRLIHGGRGVELGGRIANQIAGTIAASTVMFTLPVGYRPPYQIKLNVRYTGGGSALTVETTGDVSIGISLNAGQEAFLDGLSFGLDWS